MDRELASEPVETEVSWKRQALQILGATIGLTVAGPILTIVLPLVIIALILCGCTAVLVAVSPYAFVMSGQYSASETADAQATGTIHAQIQATATAYPLPAQVIVITPEAMLQEPLNSVEWRALDRYHSPNGHYYAAIWPRGARLAILKDGEIVSEVLAHELSPPGFQCRLAPRQWLPNSSGVLFSAHCTGRGVLRDLTLLLQVPAP